MLIRVPMTGTGAMDNQYTVDIPTCTVMSVDYGTMRAVVSVQGDDAPDSFDAPGTARYPLLNGVPVLIGLTLAQRAAWRAKLMRRWSGVRDMSSTDVV